MMDEQEYQARIARLKSEVTDLQLPKEVHDRLKRLFHMLLERFDEIDETILGMDKRRVEELAALFKQGPMVHLSHYDIFELEKASLCAEGYHHELGGKEHLHMSPEDLRGLTEKIASYRKLAFPERKHG